MKVRFAGLLLGVLWLTTETSNAGIIIDLFDSGSQSVCVDVLSSCSPSLSVVSAPNAIGGSRLMTVSLSFGPVAAATVDTSGQFLDVGVASSWTDLMVIWDGFGADFNPIVDLTSGGLDTGILLTADANPGGHFVSFGLRSGSAFASTVGFPLAPGLRSYYVPFSGFRNQQGFASPTIATQLVMSVGGPGTARITNVRTGVQPIPEPSNMFLGGIGLAVMLAIRLRHAPLKLRRRRGWA